MIDSRTGKPSVAPERTGWRDQAISARHRKWGFGCPAFDLDFLLVEYSRSKVMALVEYKNEYAKQVDYMHPTYRALRDLANRAGVPVFEARYKTDFSSWTVSPLNAIAEREVGDVTVLSEQGFVSLLYRIRGEELPAGLFDVKGNLVQ